MENTNNEQDKHENWSIEQWENYLSLINVEQIEESLSENQQIDFFSESVFEHLISSKYDDTEIKSLSSMFKQLLKFLPQRQQEVIFKFFWENKPYNQIALEMKISRQAVQKLKRKATKQLAVYLKTISKLQKNNEEPLQEISA